MRLQTFDAKGKVVMVSSEGGFRGVMSVTVKRPDSLWMKVEGPFGVDVLRAQFGGDYGVVYYPRENVAYVGSIQTMQRSGFIPINLGSTDPILGLLGLVVPDVVSNDSIRFLKLDEERYILRSLCGETISIESEGPVVSQWQKRDAEDSIEWSWEGDDFKKRSGIRIPRIVRMTNYSPKQSLTFFFETIRTNRPLKDHWSDICVPEGVETIVL